MIILFNSKNKCDFYDDDDDGGGGGDDETYFISCVTIWKLISLLFFF